MSFLGLKMYYDNMTNLIIGSEAVQVYLVKYYNHCQQQTIKQEHSDIYSKMYIQKVNGKNEIEKLAWRPSCFFANEPKTIGTKILM